jgi:hypothetical protein
MEKNKKRALRRHHREKKYKHVKKVADEIFKLWPDRPEWKENWIKRNTDNLKPCSCAMCCNMRKLGVKTLQEIKFEAIDDDIE